MMYCKYIAKKGFSLAGERLPGPHFSLPCIVCTYIIATYRTTIFLSHGNLGSSDFRANDLVTIRRFFYFLKKALDSCFHLVKGFCTEVRESPHAGLSNQNRCSWEGAEKRGNLVD